MEENSNRLQKCLKVLEKQSRIYSNADVNCTKYLDSLENLVEQLECCLKAKIESTALGKNDKDFKNKLMLKLHKGMDMPLAKLKENVLLMEESTKRLSSSLDSIENHLKRTSNKQNVVDISKWTATEPPLSEVLLWILTVKDIMQNEIMEKHHFILEFCESVMKVSSKDELHIKSISDRWNSHQTILPVVNEILQWCSQLC